MKANKYFYILELRCQAGTRRNTPPSEKRKAEQMVVKKNEATKKAGTRVRIDSACPLERDQAAFSRFNSSASRLVDE
jgi:hypothetical protein